MTEDQQILALRKIQQTLDDIKAILILSNQDKIEEVKKRLLKEGSVKYQIYELCDGTKTTQDLAQVLNKPTEYINSYISILRREGLIRTIEREGKLIHEQRF